MDSDWYFRQEQFESLRRDYLDADRALWEEVRNVARAVARCVAELRAGRVSRLDATLEDPRPK